MNLCDLYHEEIAYESMDCPMCRIVYQADRLNDKLYQQSEKYEKIISDKQNEIEKLTEELEAATKPEVFE